MKIKYINTRNNLADGFTKFLNGKLMNQFRNNILVKFWIISNFWRDVENKV